MPKWTPPETKLLLTAIAITATAHLLLFGLFRHHSARPVRNGNSAFQPVLLQLQEPEYRELAQWIRNHDPSLIAAPDAERGYGAAAQDPRQHAAVADLPQVPALMSPTTELLSPPPPKLLIDAPVPAAALYPETVQEPSGVTVTFNGHDSAVLTQIFTQLAAVHSQTGSVELEISPSGIPGLSGPCRITRSSGVPAWDQAVLSVIATSDLPAGTIVITTGGKP